MSTSRDNLPAVATTHERMDAVEAAVPVIEERTKKTLDDVRWLIALVLGSIATIVVATVGTVAFAQDAGTKAAVPVEAHVVRTDAEVAEVKLRVLALEKNQADMQRMTIESNATLKLVAMRLGVTPITLPAEPAKDAGP